VSDADPFSPARRAALRSEVLRDGLLVDPFLSHDADVPVFGLNLACAWPFPESCRAGYEALAAQLRELGPEWYVYPFATTHVTLMTLVSFSRHVQPARERVCNLAALIPSILPALQPLFDPASPERARAFTLEPQPPVLTRAAVILPLRNADGAVSRLRQRAGGLLAGDRALHQELSRCGLNVPGIIHSTIARFGRQPPDPAALLARFDALAAADLPAFEVREVLLTTETKPYMRGGEVRGRFRLDEPVPGSKRQPEDRDAPPG
jgi:hypothetical protein